MQTYRVRFRPGRLDGSLRPTKASPLVLLTHAPAHRGISPELVEDFRRTIAATYAGLGWDYVEIDSVEYIGHTLAAAGSRAAIGAALADPAPPAGGPP